MDTYVINGGNKLEGVVSLGGAKNVALKLLIVSLLTDEQIKLNNVPQISDVHTLLELLEGLGVSYKWLDNNTLTLQMINPGNYKVSLDIGARIRTSFLVLGPLLARYNNAIIPNPGGCRLGARPIDRHIQAMDKLGAIINYDSNDGYFHANTKGLKGAKISFEKNTHTGTEAVILASVLAEGETLIENAANEIEIDDLINCLNQMGAKIKRFEKNKIIIIGVKKLHGVTYKIMPDRNEEVTFAIAAALTEGNITVKNSLVNTLESFLSEFIKIGGGYEVLSSDCTRYFRKTNLTSSDITTAIHPGFMTDWQAPWAVLMTAANGISTIHETVFESRFMYIEELKKMGAKIEYFKPVVENPEKFYNFNLTSENDLNMQAVKIYGPVKLHNAILNISDLRAGATLVLAALTSKGESYIHNVEQIDRGYENFENRLKAMGANIIRIRKDAI